MRNEVWLGDCLELMNNIPNESIDMILCDLPYEKTRNSWDCSVDLVRLWQHYERIIKSNGAIVLTAQDKFTAKLILSNEKLHRYNLVWDKILTSGFLNANRMPLRVHEDICVFYKKQPVYNPQKTLGKKNHSKGKVKKNKNNNYGDFNFVDNSEKLGEYKHPKTIIKFEKTHPSKSIHPTEKPVALFEYLIKTYTHKGHLVLDNTAGSMTTAIAAINTDRDYLCIENNEKYYKQGLERIKMAFTQE